MLQNIFGRLFSRFLYLLYSINTKSKTGSGKPLKKGNIQCSDLSMAGGVEDLAYFLGTAILSPIYRVLLMCLCVAVVYLGISRYS